MLFLQKAMLVWCVIASLGWIHAAPTPERNAGQQLDQLRPHPSALNEESDLVGLLNNNAQSNVEVKENDVMNSLTVNGKTQEKEVFEKQAVSKDDGHLVSDIKQIVTKIKEQGQKPKTHVKTEVDIPEAGIHKVAVQDGAASEPQVLEPVPLPTPEQVDGTSEQVDETVPEEFLSDDDMDPDRVAEYLYETGNLEEFNLALQDIVDQKLMTMQDAMYYYDAVMDSYKRISEEIDFQKRDSRLMQSYGDDLYPYLSRRNARRGGDWGEESPRDQLMQEAMAEYIDGVLNQDYVRPRDYAYPDSYTQQEVDELLGDLYYGSARQNSDPEYPDTVNQRMRPRDTLANLRDEPTLPRDTHAKSADVPHIPAPTETAKTADVITTNQGGKDISVTS